MGVEVSPEVEVEVEVPDVVVEVEVPDVEVDAGLVIDANVNEPMVETGGATYVTVEPSSQKATCGLICGIVFAIFFVGDLIWLLRYLFAFNSAFLWTVIVLA